MNHGWQNNIPSISEEKWRAAASYRYTVASKSSYSGSPFLTDIIHWFFFFSILIRFCQSVKPCLKQQRNKGHCLDCQASKLTSVKEGFIWERSNIKKSNPVIMNSVDIAAKSAIQTLTMHKWQHVCYFKKGKKKKRGHDFASLLSHDVACIVFTASNFQPQSNFFFLRNFPECKVTYIEEYYDRSSFRPHSESQHQERKKKPAT